MRVIIVSLNIHDNIMAFKCRKITNVNHDEITKQTVFKPL